MKNKDVVLDTFVANPSTNIVDVLANSGYTLESAIADIVDNSIAAQAKHIDIIFNMDGENSTIAIKDDGWGMSKSKLHEAITYAYKNVKEKRKLTDIGRYSIGLNSASSSFCNYLFLTSKEKGGEQNSLCMDFQQLRDTDQWLVSEVKNRIDFKIDSQSGTIVVWENLKLEKNVEANKTILNDDIALSNYASRVELHLSKVFFRYIKYYGVKITINGNPVEGWDPFFTDNDNTSVVIKEKIRINGSIIRLEGYVLPVAEHLNQHEKEYEYGFNRNLTELQGFYIYRGDRLISMGGWLNIEGLNIESKCNYARIGLFVDNTLDEYLSVNFIKNQINPPKELCDMLLPYAKKVRRASNNNFDYKKVRRPYQKHKDIVIRPWIITHTELGVKAQINEEHPIIKDICSKLSARDKNKLLALLSKSIPIGEFENYRGLDDSYTAEELTAMLEDKYNEFKRQNLSNKEIKEQFLKISPFCEDKYRTDLLIFMESKDDEGRN